MAPGTPSPFSAACTETSAPASSRLGETSRAPYKKFLKVSEGFVRHRERLDSKPAGRIPDRHPPLGKPADNLNVLRALKLNQPLTKRMRATSVVCVFEGNDAAGKGGAIRRVTAAIDARYYRSVPVAAPTEEERAQPYLWRFWRHIPRRGRFVFFDRSWYGRVLVERVEGLCPEADWMRAYSEINDFELALVRHDLVLAKFCLAISKDEQYRRFKITPEDWRNREMVDRTSTRVAPWTLVEANNKYYARIKVLKTLCEALEAKLG